jgi:hypothetical protein
LEAGQKNREGLDSDLSRSVSSISERATRRRTISEEREELGNQKFPKKFRKFE